MKLVIEFKKDVYYSENLLVLKCKLLGFTENGLLGEDMVSGDYIVMEPIEYKERYHIRDINGRLNLDIIEHYESGLKEYLNWKLIYRAKVRAIDNQCIQELSELIQETRRLIDLNRITITDKFIEPEQNEIVQKIVYLCEETFISSEGISYINMLLLNDMVNCKVMIREDYTKYYLPIGIIDLYNDRRFFIKFEVINYSKQPDVGVEHKKEDKGPRISIAL